MIVPVPDAGCPLTHGAVPGPSGTAPAHFWVLPHVHDLPGYKKQRRLTSTMGYSYSGKDGQAATLLVVWTLVRMPNASAWPWWHPRFFAGGLLAFTLAFRSVFLLA